MKMIRLTEVSLPSPDRREILRYMGCKGYDAELEALIEKGLALCEGKISSRVVYTEFEITRGDAALDLGFAVTDSRALSKALDGCDSILLFAATVGIEVDRLILKYGKVSPSLALCIQAIGAERIEAVCDSFCNEMNEKYASRRYVLTPRVSPGYGDIPLSLQRDIFSALYPEKNIGLTLNDSLLMSPTKSVTAIAGIRKTKENI